MKEVENHETDPKIYIKDEEKREGKRNELQKIDFVY